MIVLVNLWNQVAKYVGSKLNSVRVKSSPTLTQFHDFPIIVSHPKEDPRCDMEYRNSRGPIQDT